MQRQTGKQGMGMSHTAWGPAWGRACQSGSAPWPMLGFGPAHLRACAPAHLCTCRKLLCTLHGKMYETLPQSPHASHGLALTSYSHAFSGAVKRCTFVPWFEARRYDQLIFVLVSETQRLRGAARVRSRDGTLTSSRSRFGRSLPRQGEVSSGAV